jgi:hypothetical protein
MEWCFKHHPGFVVLQAAVDVDTLAPVDICSLNFRVCEQIFDESGHCV